MPVRPVSARRPTPRRGWRTIALTAAGIGALIVPATAQSGALVDLGARSWLGATTAGFAPDGPNTIVAPPGIYSVGSAAGFSWCSPYANSLIQSAVVHVTRAAAASAVTISAGPHTNGSGGLAKTDAEIPAGSVGTNLTLDPLGSVCVGADVRQTHAARSTVKRTWTLSLADTVLEDEQGPSVSDLQVHGPETNGWLTGAITVLWEADDNALLRGTTGVEVSDGAAANLGNAADNVELSATLDPGADGTHTVTVYRTAGGGWPTAEQTVTIKVDRTPPTVPQMIAPPTGAFPVELRTTPSSDGATGSGVAAYQFTDDAGATILASDTLTRPGTYTVCARAVDVAGNTSAWSLPIAIVVPANASGSPGGGTVLHLAAVAVDGRAPSANGTFSLTRTFDDRLELRGTLANPPGTAAPHASVTVADAGRVLARGRTNARGQFALAIPVRRSGTMTLHADDGGALIGISVKMRPLLVLTRAERRAVAGAPLPVGADRSITVTGTAAPTPLVAGQPVQLEYLLGRSWLPLGAPSTVTAGGHWRVRYAVANPGRAEVDMRVVLPTQPGLAFAAGISPVFRVAIR